MDRLFIPLRQLQRHGFDQALPIHLDGQANIYFGVLPRLCKGGAAADAAIATCLWVDEIRKPWPEGLPQPSALVETSTSKYQAYWFLTEPSHDLESLQDLNRRLAGVLGGDNVWDRARIMRLPGFLNVKPEHPEHPRAQLLEIHPERRFTLEQLEALLPPISRKEGNQGSDGHREGMHHSKFDPHAGGGDVPQVMLDEMRAELVRRGARRYHDDRLVMPCPFPHVGGRSCDCFNGFYWSP